jgi:DNA invertase Pin-like site-specific DNA recombinase
LASDPQEKAIILNCNNYVIASLAQMERELFVERTKAGLAAAKERR